jgi:hypothetical protein
LIDERYSGKAHEHADLIQGIIAPDGTPLWVSDVLPGSAHDITAAREQVLSGLRPWLKILPALADTGYEGAGAGILVPVKKSRKANSTPTRKPATCCCAARTTRANAASRSCRSTGALSSTSASAPSIGDIMKAALVLTYIEHKMLA